MEKGMINAARAEQPAQPDKPQGQQPGKFKTKVAEALPPEMQEPFERVVLAGMKVMYSKDMQQDVQQIMGREGPIWKKLAEGVANLMTILDRQSGKGLPQEVIIPAAIELVNEYGDFLNQQGKTPVSPEDLQEASVYVAVVTAKLFGASDQDIQQAFAGQQGQQGAEPTGEPGEAEEAGEGAGMEEPGEAAEQEPVEEQ